MGPTAEDAFENNARLWGSYLGPGIEHALDPLGLGPAPLVEASAQWLTEGAATVAAGAVSALAPSIRGLYLKNTRAAVTPAGAHDRAGESETPFIVEEDPLEPLVESAPFLLLAIDRQGVVIRAEGSAFEGDELRVTEFVGSSVFDLDVDEPELADATHEPPLFDEQDGVSGTGGAGVSIVRDLSDRKRAQVELRNAVEFRDRIMESVTNGIAALDVGGRFTHVNQRFAEITGNSADELIGRHVGEILPAHLVEAASSPIARVLTEAASIAAADVPFRRPDGTKRTVRFSIGPLRAEGEIIGAVATAEDITEQRQIEQRLAQAQKMEAVGRLAGGMAHEMNNLMTAVIGYAELVMESLPQGGRIHAQVEQIRAAGERAVSTSSRLLALARRQVIQPKVVDLNDLIFDVHRTLRHLIGEDIELSLLPTRGLHPVEVDPSQFEQVLLNLAVNARDAMPRGGKLVIHTANLSLPESSGGGGSVTTDWALLSVSDSGTGMDEDVKRHLFEPFFTTKEVGKGTGLGLATCYGIVSQAGGRIDVESAPGEGATFRIYLPASNLAPLAGTPDDDAGYLPGGTETILLVEDEDAVRELAAFVLGEQGYTVLTAANGEDAVRVARRHTGEIDLLLTDVVMPEMGGRELAESLRITQPATRVLFMSGYAADEIVHRGIVEQQVNFLEKPFSPLLLLRKVRDVLDDPSAENESGSGRAARAAAVPGWISV